MNPSPMIELIIRRTHKCLPFPFEFLVVIMAQVSTADDHNIDKTYYQLIHCVFIDDHLEMINIVQPVTY